jgi:hypothetical protein
MPSKGETMQNYRAYLTQYTEKPVHLMVMGDYYELSIQNSGRAGEYELTSQANMESSAYRIIGVHDDFILLMEEHPPKREIAIQYSFIKKVQVS